MKHTRIASITTLFVVVQALVPTQWLITTDTGSVQATYLQNDNAGSFELTFLNPEGIVHREGMSVTGGVAFLSENALTGSLMSVQVEPASMRRRDTVTLNTTTPSGSKFFMTVVDCEQETPLA
ncbi:MAG: hypothetical protein LBP53_06675 [Candidatus Peribacteria bacterium]|nr:hypothetical protein [Candidatus Peribacteria bacterium]